MRRWLFTCVLIVAVAQSGCASGPNSNTRRYEERVSLMYVDGLQPTAGQDETFGIDTVVGVVLDLGVQAVKYLINREAQKYEATFSGSSPIFMGGLAAPGNDQLLPKRINSGGVFLFTRVVEAEQGVATRLGSGLESVSPLDDASIATIANDAVASMKPWFGKKNPDRLKSLMTAELQRVAKPINDDHVKTHKRFLTFVLVAVVQPFRVLNDDTVAERRKGSFRDDAMQLTVAGYSYRALKAKKAGVHVPFTEWDDVKSLLTLELKGPQGERGFDSTGYHVASVFALSPTAGGKWTVFDPAKPKGMASAPLAVPQSSVLTASGTVLETAEIKKTLEDLAKAVGDFKIKPEDIGVKKAED